MAAIDHLPESRRVRFLTFWREDLGKDAPGALVGLYPVLVPRLAGGVLLLGWRHDHSILGLPLLDRDQAEAVVNQFLDWLDEAFLTRGGIVFPQMPVESETFSLHACCAEARGGIVRWFSVHTRPVLRRGLDEVAPAAMAKLRRKRRKLEQVGPVDLRLVTCPGQLARALDDFLALESAGWKGRAGTALACTAQTESFFRAATMSLAERGQCTAAFLLAGGNVVSAGLLLGDGRRRCVWKIAFDERYASVSPGLMLDAELGLAALSDPSTALTDSCDAPNPNSLLSTLWTGSQKVADVFIPAPGLSGTLGLACEGTRRLSRRSASNLQAELARTIGEATSALRQSWLALVRGGGGSWPRFS